MSKIHTEAINICKRNIDEIKKEIGHINIGALDFDSEKFDFKDGQQFALKQCLSRFENLLGHLEMWS